MMLARLSGFIAAIVAGDDPLPQPLPSTFEFIDTEYAGTRFNGQQVVVFGGTSGIGFATAAMFMQECASRTVVVGRNAQQGHLAARVLRERVLQDHCTQNGTIEFLRADITKKDEVRSVLDTFRGSNDGRLQVVVQSASVAGYIGNFADLPDEILFSGRDAVYNNLYGTKTVTQQVLKFWGKSDCAPWAGKPCAKLDYLPSFVIISSENGVSPTPTAESYGQSKHGMIGLATGIASAFPGELRVNAILPGLIDTPLTWNQVRNAVLNADGSISTDSEMQTSWQCIVDGKLIKDGECIGGGTGYGCPCEDIFRDDPRNAAVWGEDWPAIDPRRVGAAILGVSDASSNLTGASLVVDNDGHNYECIEGDGYTGKALWRTCPRVDSSTIV